MKISLFTAALSWALVAGCSTSAPQQASVMGCSFDRPRVLALDEDQFDRDVPGSWRELSLRPGCNLAAADLLREYRQSHRLESGLMYWHEAQVRAIAGQYQEAIPLMERARMPVEADRAGWNPYVEATIAFLRKDRTALENARLRLAAVHPPIGKDVPPVIDGFMEVEMDNGPKQKIRWPPNIDVVEGLENCFDKAYGEAYNNQCRQHSKQR